MVIRVRRLVACALILVAQASMAESPASDTIVACTHNSTGSLRVVADESGCRLSERLLTWDRTGAPGAGFRVVDGNGQILGTFLTLDRLSGNILVQHDLLGFQLWLDRENGSISNSNGSVLYEQMDCQGQPWFTVAHVGRMQGPLQATGQYLVVADEALEGRVFVSRRQIFSPFCQNSVPSSFLSGFYARMLEVTLDDVGFEFPVALPLRIDSKSEE